MGGWSLREMPSQAGKTVLVTGANRGLGFESALALAGAGAEVVLACRDTGKAEAAAARIRAQFSQARLRYMPLDVADLGSVSRFAERCRAQALHFDLLLHNAAAILQPQGKTVDGFETHLGTNHLGPFALTGLLLDQLKPQARVVSMSSLAHRLTQGLDLDDVALEKRPYKDMDAYGRSKLAVLLFTFEFARRLAAQGSQIKALVAHPGYTGTNLDLGGFWMRLSTRLFSQKPAVGALPALRAATDPQAENGDYYGPGGYQELGGAPKKVDCSPQARDAALATRLWQISEQLTGVTYLDRRINGPRTL